MNEWSEKYLTSGDVMLKMDESFQTEHAPSGGRAIGNKAEDKNAVMSSGTASSD